MFSNYPIRWKMTLAALVPQVFILLLVTLAAFYLINAWVVDEAQNQVRNDLNAAREVLHNEVSRVGSVVRFTAHSSELAEALKEDERGRMAALLARIRERENLDVLSLCDLSGKASDLPAFARRARQGENYAGAVLLSAERLAQIDPALAKTARIEGRAGAENRGMLLVGASPVVDDEGTVLGCLFGGVLLNGNLALVDRIREVVYGDKAFEGAEVGSATIFLEETRVATTIRLKDGRRALGTRVSDEVAEAVLRHRRTWLDRARVVDQWYLTAYEPILDAGGEAIGALYVGLLERPYRELKVKASLILLGLFLVGGGLGFVLSHMISSRLSRPVLKLATAAEKVARGEREVTLPASGRDEVGHLSDAFDRMTVALREREEALQDLNRLLEGKVAERTAQLEEKSLELIRAQEELLRSEKLAAVGSLAAGVAHEINNPTAIIRGNVEILLMQFGEAAEGREEAEEIKQQTERIALITQNMLAFAREQAIELERFDLHKLLGTVLDQLGHQVPLDGIEVRREFADNLPTVNGDAQRLRQVFVNLAVNAVQAMAGEGELSVATRGSDTRVEIDFRDTGPGVSAEIREKIFNPFFTTKSAGTGLGLSISYGIVKAHGGDITVKKAEGGGALFRIVLPLRTGGGFPL